MEVLNKEKTKPTGQPEGLSKSLYLFGGIVMILCGLVWLMYNYGLVGEAFVGWLFSWQMFIVAVGGWLLCARRWALGGTVMALGVAMLLFGVLDIHISFERFVLPLLIVVGGVACIVNALRK